MSNLKPLGPTPFARVASLLFSSVVALKNLIYSIFPPMKMPFPIISVGGISAGGTGKTPLTGTIIEYVISKGYTPVLFSRGYGRESTESLLISADGTTPLWSEVGDEPAMLRHRYPQLWLAIDGKRTRVAQKLIQQLPQKCVAILDDGFQHRAMPRDLDIVTVPDSIESDFLMPTGLLREPISSLKRADAICIMTQNSEISLPSLEKVNPTAPRGVISTEPGKFIHNLTNEQKSELTSPITAFSGIARPERFHTMLKKVCKNEVSVLTFPDHHVFSDRDLQLLKMDSNPALVTTEKDWIRSFGKNTAIANKLWYFTIAQRFADIDFETHFFNLIDICLENSNDRSID